VLSPSVSDPDRHSSPTRRSSDLDYDGTSPYVMLTPTYDQPRGGFTPKPVQTFLDKHAHLMVGVAGAGNRNFGEHYCQAAIDISRSEEHTSELQSRFDLVCRLLLE